MYIKKLNFLDEYIQNSTRYNRYCDVENLALLSAIYNNLDKSLQRYVYKSTIKVEINDFIRDLKRLLNTITLLSIKTTKKKHINEMYAISNVNY